MKPIITNTNPKEKKKDVLQKCYGGDVSRKRKLLEQQKEGDVNVDDLSRTHSLRNLARNGTNPPKKSNKEFKHLNREFTWIMIRTSRVHRIGRRKSHDLRQQCQSENQECPRDHFN
jgi:hypothetical protein